MNDLATPAAAIAGQEHWTTKDGGVKLFLFEKVASDPAKTRGTISPSPNQFTKARR